MGLNHGRRQRRQPMLRQYAATYVDELIRIAPPCDHPLTPEMRANTIALVEGAMHDLIRAAYRIVASIGSVRPSPTLRSGVPRTVYLLSAN